MAKFTQGHEKVGGRKKGTPNKASASLRQAIMDAGDFVGEGGKFDEKKRRIIPGRDGLKGYLAEMAVTRPELYMPLLARVLPLELTGAGGGPVMHQMIGPETTLKDAAFMYSQLLQSGGYAISPEEQQELDTIIDGRVVNGEVKLLPGPAKKAKR